MRPRKAPVVVVSVADSRTLGPRVRSMDPEISMAPPLMTEAVSR